MGPPDRTLLRQDPARVEITDRAGSSRWLADPPHSRGGGPRWLVTEDVAEAGVWPWSEAIELAGAAHRSLLHRSARAVAVTEPWAVGPDAQRVAAEVGLPDPGGVRCLVLGPGRSLLVLRVGGRRELHRDGPGG